MCYVLIGSEANDNSLSGNLSVLSRMSPALYRFSVAKNKFTGSIPVVSHLVKLHVLELFGNNLSGALPNISMNSLNYCNIGGNSGLCRNFVLSKDLCNFSSVPACPITDLTDCLIMNQWIGLDSVNCCNSIGISCNLDNRISKM